MKTGRVRKKETLPPQAQAPAQEPHVAKTPAARPAPSPPVVRRKNKVPTGVWIVGGLFVVFVCFVMIMTVFGRKKVDEWVEVTRVSGEWTTTVTVLGPQVSTEERWQSDCTSDANAMVRAGTCVLKDTNQYDDTVVDEYEEYAYNIYFEETHTEIYEARGVDFATTQLKTDDWWEGNLHYVLKEELDRASCVLSDYTVWVDDPSNQAQEIEVYLSDCEVWDHVTVYERVYEQRQWCQCDVTTLAQIGAESQTGTGSNVRWPQPFVPQGGQTEQAFKGRVTFLGDDYTYTTTTQDLNQYQDYLTSQYYLGLSEGKPFTVSKNPGK